MAEMNANRGEVFRWGLALVLSAVMGMTAGWATVHTKISDVRAEAQTLVASARDEGRKMVDELRSDLASLEIKLEATRASNEQQFSEIQRMFQRIEAELIRLRPGRDAESGAR